MMSCRDSWVSAERILVVGDRDSGKTTALEELRSSYRANNCEIGGFLALANPEKTWYRLNSLATGESRLAFSEESGLGSLRLGRFFVDASVFAWANAQVHSDLEHCKVVFFDEIGKLELQGKGFAPSFRSALEAEAVSVVAAVRTSFLDEVIHTFSLDKHPYSLVNVVKPIRNES